VRASGALQPPPASALSQRLLSLLSGGSAHVRYRVAMASRASAGAAPVAASPALRADVERLAFQLDDWGRRYLTREWRPALEELRAARGEVAATLERLAALSDAAELLSVAAPLGATGFRWAADLIDSMERVAFIGMGRALHHAADSCPALPELVRASVDHAAARARLLEREFEQAARLLERALEARTRLLGPADGATLDTTHALGVCMHAQYLFAEAQSLLKAAYDGRKRLLGPNDPATLHSLQLFCHSAIITGQTATVEALLRVTMAGQEAALGPDHPHTLGTVELQALLCTRRLDLAAAEALYRRTLAGNAAAHGEASFYTLQSRRRLIECLLQLPGRKQEALPLCAQQVVVTSHALGASHPDTLQAIGRQAECLVSVGRSAEALPLARTALETAKAALGPTHDTTLFLTTLMGVALFKAGRPAEARELVQRELPAMRALRGDADPKVQTMSELLTQLEGMLPPRGGHRRR